MYNLKFLQRCRCALINRAFKLVHSKLRQLYRKFRNLDTRILKEISKRLFVLMNNETQYADKKSALLFQESLI